MNDRSGTGRLSHEDFVKCLRMANMNATQREIEVLIKELDPKETNAVEYEEFTNCCFLSYLFTKEYKLRLLFEEYDKTKEGTITLN